MRLEPFCELHNITKNNFYVMKKSHNYPSTAVKKVDNKLDINPEFFYKRKKFQQKVFDQSIANYYILNPTMSDSDLARYLTSKTKHSLTSWLTWLSHSLWKQPLPGILNYQVSNYWLSFLRLTNKLIKDN